MRTGDGMVRLADGLARGGDHASEQWDRDVWDEDVRLMRGAGAPRVIEADSGVEAVRRVGDDRSHLFPLNPAGVDRAVAAGRDLLTGADVGPVSTVPAGGVRVLRETA